MTENSTTTSTDGTPTGFVPGYTPLSGTRIWRGKIRTHADGTARVTFRGDVANATTDLWVEQGTSGRLSLYGEVQPTEDTATEITVAMVPTGKRPPEVDGGKALRLGSVKGMHVYLLAVDGTVDRVAFDAEMAARKARRQAERAAWLAANGYTDEDGDDEDGDDSITLLLT